MNNLYASFYSFTTDFKYRNIIMMPINFQSIYTMYLYINYQYNRSTFYHLLHCHQHSTFMHHHDKFNYRLRQINQNGSQYE